MQWAAIFDLRIFIARFNNQSMAASSLDPEVAFGPQKEWVSPRLERPWVGPSAVSLIPEGATEEDVIEALELWAVPKEAWPKIGKKKSVEELLNYTLHKEGHPDIFVHLLRQVFTKHPEHEEHTYDRSRAIRVNKKKAQHC